MAHWETPITKLTDSSKEKKFEAINLCLSEGSTKYESFLQGKDVKSPEEAVKLGFSSIRDANYDDALGYFFSALGVDDVKYFCLKGIGMTWYHLARYEDMIMLFDVLLYNTPYDLTTRTYRLKAYNALRYKLKRELTLSTDEKIALAHCHMTFDEQKLAYKLLNECRENLKAEDKLNLALMVKGISPEKYDLQKEYFQEAVNSYEANNDNPYKPYHYLGVAHFHQIEDDPTEEGLMASIDLFNKSVKHNPLYRENYFFLSHAYKGLKSYHKALKYINKAIEISDERMTYYYVQKAYLQYQVDEYEAAIQTIIETEEHDYEHGESPYTKMLAGYCYYEMDELDRAEEWVNRARIAGYDIEEVERILGLINEERKTIKKSSGLFSGLKNMVNNCFGDDD